MVKKRKGKKKEAVPNKPLDSSSIDLPIKFPTQGSESNSEESIAASKKKGVYSGKTKSTKSSKKKVKEPDEIVKKDRSKSVSEKIQEQMGDPLELESKRRKLIAACWKERNNLYRSIFGKPSYVTPKDYGPPSEMIPDDFFERQESVQKRKDADTANPGDPTLDEQHLAVLAYGPDPTRPYWTYVTAGLATPWLQSEWQQVSGFGCELMMKSPEDSPWVPQLLRTLAFYVINHAGLLSPGKRLSLNSPVIPNSESLLRNIFIWYADEVPNDLYQLPSGAFGIFAAVGMTDKESAYADSVDDYGTWCLQEILRHVGHHQITDPQRKCATEESNIDGALATMKAKAEMFRNFAPNEQEEEEEY